MRIFLLNLATHRSSGGRREAQGRGGKGAENPPASRPCSAQPPGPAPAAPGEPGGSLGHPTRPGKLGRAWERADPPPAVSPGPGPGARGQRSSVAAPPLRAPFLGFRLRCPRSGKPQRRCPGGPPRCPSPPPALAALPPQGCVLIPAPTPALGTGLQETTGTGPLA